MPALQSPGIAHGGGPTAVLNASLAGVVDECRTRASALYGAQFGLTRATGSTLIQLTPEKTAAIAATPGSAIGSTRARLSPYDLTRLIARLRREGIQVVFYTGGNGSMQTALELSRRFQVIGIPKTIDNDLLVTHHTPGYASTGYFFACAARDVGADNQSLPSPICVLPPRNAGPQLRLDRGRHRAGPPEPGSDSPHLIYFPERPLSLDRIVADVETVYRRLGRVVIAVCEGQLDDQGTPFGAEVDRPHSPSIAWHRISATPWRDCCRKSWVCELAPKSRVCWAAPWTLCPRTRPPRSVRMRTRRRTCRRRRPDRRDDRARSGRSYVHHASRICRAPRKNFSAPTWISPAGNDVEPAFIDYATPLIGEVPGYPRLD